MKKHVLGIFALGLCILVLTCGFTFPTKLDFSSSLEKETESVENFISPEELMNVENRLLLQEKFESEVEEMIRVQNEYERAVVLGAQNLTTKTHLTKKERKKLLNVYQPMPKTVEEYKKMSRDIKREERIIPKPKLEQDKKLVKVPSARYLVVKYNDPPGTQNIDLRNLKRERQIYSNGVVSPEKNKIAYTSIYYSGYNDKVSSEVYCIDLDTQKPLKTRIKEVSLATQKPVKLLDTAIKEEYPSLFKTLTIVDWSADGTKLAIKERIGSSTFGLWQTNLWVYDLTDNSTKNLVEVRDAVKYWWKTNKNVNIDDYRWDILPLGWDENSPSRIIVCAYAYTKNKSTMFLGLYSVDAKGQNTGLLSVQPISLPISENGLVLKPVYD